MASSEPTRGLIGREPTINENLGSRLEMTVTGRGAITGKVIADVKATSFKGQLAINPETPKR